jgi:HrpA-like RNA helicase/O-acetyl-ADP-ribose deacetylase (regulator of RNase III)/8-oxo-dGTP pyrophosphatase MutT (NUDIX family)/predicted RNA-binding protein YlqC (UPF0109 family)
MSTSLLAVIEEAKLPNPPLVLEELEREHGVTTAEQLVEVLSDPDGAQSIRTLWRLRLHRALGFVQELPTSTQSALPAPTSAHTSVKSIRDWVGGMELLRCHVAGSNGGAELRVIRGDLTDSTADAIVNAANSHLMHGAGLAGAIARKGGSVIQAESSDWVSRHGPLDVGAAMSTSSGKLPCKYVIHAVGPSVSHASQPTPEHARQLRNAAWNALVAADQLGLRSVVIPGISTGIFGYPRDLGAREIVSECARFCREHDSTTIRVIGLMNFDDPTVSSFLAAVEDVAHLESWPLTQPQVCESDPQRLASQNPHTVGRSSGTSEGLSSKQSGLKESESLVGHKAGGVLLARASSSGLEVLLGVEYRPTDRVPGRYVNFLGGKIEDGERPVDTAAREFSEEVGGVIKKDEMAQLLSNANKSQELWLPFAEYTLYISHWDVDERADTLPEKYAKRTARPAFFGSGAEHEYLVWISWDELVTAAKKTQQQRVITPYGTVAISSLLSRFLTDFEPRTTEIIDRIVVSKIVEGERARIQHLTALNDSKLISALLRSDWRLSLTSPPMAPPPPIQLLQPSDEVYKGVVNALPTGMPSRVVSVRRVNASARVSDYQAELTRLKATSADVSEKEPLYHGTPERWRATAIALNGFDMSICLSGRAEGDGVYTSPEVLTAMIYAAGAGSLLHLRGIVATNCRSPTDNIIPSLKGSYIFPNPRYLLPLMIIDFAAADSQDLIELERKSAQDDYKVMLEKRKALEASMKKQEKVFCREMAARLRRALKVYSATFEEYDNSTRASKTGGGDQSSCSKLRHLLIERQQFAACLPMYEVKPQITEVLQRHEVVVLTADTGSGKSTQLPQILMDDVLSRDEARRIAVLQPRRVNAVSLSKRVAKERGLPHGQEIGYRIGRGETNVTNTTRVEFMTHGLFVEIARDCDQLLTKYCAVIVDEAHERSVDVDLSLALLRRALQQAQQPRQCKHEDGGILFRVVVTSATIKEEASRFQQYLDPSMRRSAIFSVKGCAFPVHIEHRTDVQVDPQFVGTAGVGKVLTSTAIQTAMDILRATKTGNILIFLPGEGAINDALEKTRQDILMSLDGEEAKDPSLFGSDTALRFQMAVERHGSKEGRLRKKKVAESKETADPKKITVCILAFHGKISRAQRDHILNPPPDQRFVIFSTNLAETGVTLPNVRYVIDTGLERRVRWNAAVDVNEMVTEPVTLSSMKQRAGRAGRTASGICIRLFPANDESSTTAEATARRAVEPAVQNSMIYKAVLYAKHMLQVYNEDLKLIDPIDPPLLALTEERLRELGALDEHGNLTREGNVLLSLGVDLRLGRFLIACSRFGCLATGAKLVSLLMASDGSERLLPHRKRLDDSHGLDEFIDESGDHLTLLNIVNGYDQAVERHEAMTWCRKYEFDEEVFSSAEISREHLLKVLDRLQFDIIDNDEVIEQHGDIQSSLRRALCSAYFDQIAATRAAGVPKAGFTRIIDTAKRNGALDMMTNFAGRTQPAGSLSDNGDPARIPSEPVVKAASHTSLWLDQVSKSGDIGRLVIFGSQMLTDGSQRAEPTVQLLTYVTEEEVSAGAPEWCRLVDFKELLKSSARETIRAELSDGVRRYVVMDRGAWLKQLRRKFPSATVTVESDALVVTSPRRMCVRVELEIKKMLRVVEPESVTLQLPGDVKMGKIIGKSGQNIKALEANIQALLSSEQHGVGRRHVERHRILSIDSSAREITITLVGEAKALMPVIVGRVQSLIVQTHGDSMLPLITKALGDRGQEMQQSPRLGQLLNSVPPRGWQTRDEIMLQLAHVLVWKCDVSIYGGFLRDWVVRGEPANDIDVLVAPPQTTTASVEQVLQRSLAQTPGAVQQQVKTISRRQKGSALTLTVRADGVVSIDIDLVDPAGVQQKTHPGVDCDAGNLLLSRRESLRKKVPTAGDSLASALENVRRKQFVFYYPLHAGAPTQNMAIARLKKYLERGWTCLSPVPLEVIQDHLTDSERQFIKPSRHV